MERNELYRSENGIFLGVCRGLGEWREIPVWLIRLIVILSLFAGFFPTLLVYVTAALLMKKEVRTPVGLMSHEEIKSQYSHVRAEVLVRMKEKLGGLEKRTRELESYVTSPERNWSQRL